MTDQRKPATEATRAANQQALVHLPPDDNGDLADAQRGLVAPLDTMTVTLEHSKRVVWDIERFAAFQQADAPTPDSVHPSLWRQAKLTTISGLFQVIDRVHQIRGLDLSNITFIEGNTGRIVVDSLTSVEVARAALALVERHLGKRPIVALIYTHCHADHFGGSRAIAEAAGEPIPIFAPDGFMRFALSENLHAGNAMQRRAAYMYGATLPADAMGVVDAGLGKTTSQGTSSLVPPNRSICTTGEQVTIDGVDFVFQLTPDTEAPAEMHFYLPGLRALCIADNACAGMHNLYTPRGAQVRDALAWIAALDKALEMFGDQAEVVFGGHHWPRWGKSAVRDYLEAQRDLYRYIHDQTLRLTNHGLTMTEIPEALPPPADLAGLWFVREYYGTLNHNAKAVYQRYLGYFDGNPATLNPLSPEAAGRQYITFMGGAASLLEQARASFGRGEYRWVAQVVNHLVFAEPSNKDARMLQADALEQLGYQSESAVWRNFYLAGAQDLRREDTSPARVGSPRLLAALPVGQLFDYLAVSLNGPKSAGLEITVDWHVTDQDVYHRMFIRNGTLRHKQIDDSPESLPAADVTVVLPRAVLGKLFSGEVTLEAATEHQWLTFKGDIDALGRALRMFDRFDRSFSIVTP